MGSVEYYAINANLELKPELRSQLEIQQFVPPYPPCGEGADALAPREIQVCRNPWWMIAWNGEDFEVFDSWECCKGGECCFNLVYG